MEHYETITDNETGIYGFIWKYHQDVLREKGNFMTASGIQSQQYKFFKRYVIL